MPKKFYGIDVALDMNMDDCIKSLEHLGSVQYPLKFKMYDPVSGFTVTMESGGQCVVEGMTDRHNATGLTGDENKAALVFVLLSAAEILHRNFGISVVGTKAVLKGSKYEGKS